MDTDSFAFASGLVRDLDKLLNFGNRRAGEVLDRDEGVFQVREGVVGRYLLRGERDQVVNPLLHQESNLGKKNQDMKDLYHAAKRHQSPRVQEKSWQNFNR